MKTATIDKTPARTRTPRREDTELWQDIRLRLDKFFGKTPYRVEWGRARGGRVTALITYTDFMSERLTRQMLADIVPQEVRVVLKREYSDRAIAELLLKEYKKNRVAVVDCYDGELRPETIRGFVNGRLDAVEMLG